MKFDELCKLVLESDYDTLTGQSKVFSLSNDAIEKAKTFSLSDVKELIKKTTLPFTTEYLTRFIIDDLASYLPAETRDLKQMLTQNIWSTFDESEKKSRRAANVFFAFLKKKRLIVGGIPKDSDNDDIENLVKDLESEIPDPEYNRGIATHDIDKLGGVSPRSTGHPEDESMF